MTILFDLDGTLIDSTEAILQSFEYAFAQKGELPRSREQIKALIGHPLDFMFEHLGIAKERVPEFVDTYKEKYREINRPMTELLPGAKEAVVRAGTIATLGVVTTKTGVYSRELLEYLGIMHHFQTLVGREDVLYPKPHPEPVLKAMKHLDAHPETTWMIGDTCMDINSAAKAKVKSVAVQCGYGAEEELQRCSEFIKENALEAVQLIEKIQRV